jgi:hypothetical protein
MQRNVVDEEEERDNGNFPSEGTSKRNPRPMVEYGGH